MMKGSQIILSAEWAERMRRFVQAGVISIPIVSAAVRIHTRQVLMSQAPLVAVCPGLALQRAVQPQSITWAAP